MQRIKRSTYLVESGETVEVEVRPQKVGPFAILSLNGSSLKALGPLHWKFKVAAPAGGSEFGMVVCAFPSDAPNDARYDLFFSGSAGGETFQGSDILKTDPTHSRGFELRAI